MERIVARSPTWQAEPQKKPGRARGPGASHQRLPLQGELHGAGADAFQCLLEHAANRPEVVVDCAILRRMDFVAAGILINTFTSLQRAGKTCGAQR